MKQTRNTPTKTQIVSLLKGSEVALSPSEILQLSDGLCDRVTIYRVLDRLLEEGFIHKIATVDGTIKYAVCHTCTEKEHKHNHIHFTCEHCATTTCITEVEPFFSLPPGYKVHTLNFTISGVCPDCL